MKIINRRREGVAFAALAVSVTLLSACGGDFSGDPATESGVVKVASPAPNTLFTFNEMVARELGFYEEEGLKVELVALSDTVPGGAMVANGNADIALMSATETLSAATKSQALRLSYDERTGGTDFIFGIVVPNESGIKDLRQLKGQSIGLGDADEKRAILASALEQAGMSLDDVDTTVVGPGGASVAEALRTGRIAAYTGGLQDFVAFEDAGLPIDNIIPEGLEGLPVGGYVSTNETLNADDDVVKFLRALAKGTYAALERPEIAEAVTRKAAPEQWREPEVAEMLIQGLSETLRPFDGETFGGIKPERWSNAQDLLVKIGSMEGGADLDQLLRDNLVGQINDWDRAEVLAVADVWLADNPVK